MGVSFFRFCLGNNSPKRCSRPRFPGKFCHVGAQRPDPAHGTLSSNSCDFCIFRRELTKVGPLLAAVGSGSRMYDATKYQDQPITACPIALQVQERNSQPVMVSLRMALGMAAFGASVVALGFALVFGEGKPGPANARSQRAAPETALSTSLRRNGNAAVIITDASVVAFATAHAERGANAPIELQTRPLIVAARQATTGSARPLTASSPRALESAEANRKRRGAFYEDIPSGKSLKRP